MDCAIPTNQKSSLTKKIMFSMLFAFALFLFGNPVTEVPTASAAEATVTKTQTYDNGNTKLNNAIKKVIQIVGGAGGLLFTLAILVISLFIIFGSISAQKMRTVWVSLISCCLGALIFYSAFFLSGVISTLATGA